MTPERWAKIEDVFQAALDEPRERRGEFIRAECAGDEEMRAQVEKLVARYETEETFLESPVWTDSQLLQGSLKQQIAASLEDTVVPAQNKQEFIGRRIGVYRLAKEIGKGGMGAVFLGERADGEFRQNVAIKLIKRGMDTDFIIKRFRHERQILATLNHPNIARLLDGGTTEDDLPYFVMEFVEGETLIKFCKSKNLDLRRKLELFLQICSAIAYAHKRRIIHRDIKPSNIVVTDEGDPKLLDFGIAKILDPDLIHESVMPTATQMRLMTPEYASPEQARGEDVTEASDQYSLGVLLYELITGNRPYKFPSRAPHEIARIICEAIPSEPSSGDFEKLITGDFDVKNSAELCRQLDRIVLKALRKDPAERYASITEFAADIQRFLNNEPVRAKSFPDAAIAAQASSKTGTLPIAVNQKSIAVLPLKMRSALPGDHPSESDYLSIGLADALITRLSNVRQFVVRPTSSVLKFSEAETDAFAAGRELNVAFVLDGSILKTDARIRVSIQLLNVAESSIVWAERFDEELTDVLTLEDKISEKVASQLVPQLTTGERRKLAKRGTDVPEAYEAYLRGRFYRNIFTEDSFSQAFAAYQEAISYDPNYALAYAGIADYYIWLGVYGALPPKSCYPLAKEAAFRAIELDSELADAYASLSFAQICGDYDWIEAEKNAVRAVELNPNYSVARLWYSYILQTSARPDEGIAQAKKAIELDPLAYINYHVLGLNYYFARRFDEAVEQAAANVKNFPGLSMAHHTQSWFLRYLGRHEEALKATQRALELSGNNSLFVLFGRAQALAAAGRHTETEEVLGRIFEQGAQQYLSYYQVALVYVFANEKEKALDALERSFEDHEGWLIWLRIEPALDKLRREPRFIQLRRKVDQRAIGVTEEIESAPEIAAGSQKSIAVLPFKITSNPSSGGNTGGDEFLGIGLADALITRLSNVRQFVVRPTSSILRFAEKPADAIAAGHELRVKYILSGDIHRTGEAVHLSTQLLDVETNEVLWAETFDESFTDVLQLEDTISAKVAESLIPHLTGEERRQLKKRGTDNADAYEAYLRGRFHWNTFTEEGLKQAIYFYQKAVAHDPNYAVAYAGIADYFIWLGIFGVLPPKQTYPTAQKMAERAIEIDDQLAEAYAALGFAQLCGDYDWVTSENNIRRAIEINPNYAVAHNWLAIELYTASRFDEGIAHAQKSIELDPLAYQNYRTLSWGYYFSRRFDESLAVITETVEKFPTTGTALSNRSWLLRAMGRTGEALKDSQKALETASSSIFVLTGHAQAFAAAGRLPEAEKLIEYIKTNPETKYVSHYQISLAYCYANEKEKALAALAQALTDRDGWLVWLNVEPALDILRNEPEFIELIQKINPPGLKIAAQKPIVATKLKAVKEVPAPAAVAAEQKSIAVLPFKVLKTTDSSGTNDTDFLSLGLTDALITRLSNVQRFIVRPTSSVLRFEQDSDDSFAAGQELKVGYVLDGNILKSDKKIRVSVQLLNVDNRSTVWAERYDEDFTDVLEVEDKISAKVAASLVPQLTGEEQRRLQKRSTDKPEAFEAYLRGRFHWNNLTDGGAQQAIYFYRQAIAIDPEYALAYAGIADYYVILGVYGVLPHKEFYPPAKQAALRAIELDNTLSEAYTALSLTQLCGEFDWQTSEKNFRRAIELNPNNAVAHLWCAHNLFSQKRFEEGAKSLARAIEIDPFSFQNQNLKAWSLYFKRDIDGALARIEEIIEEFPSVSHSYFSKVSFLNSVGRTDEALLEVERAKRSAKDNLFTTHALAQTYAAAGKKREAEELIEKTRNPGSQEHFSLFQIAQVYSYLKDKDTAFEFFERSFEERESQLVWLAVEPSLDFIRDDERYFSLLEKINYPLAKERPATQLTKLIEETLPAEETSPTIKPEKFSTRKAIYISAAIIALGLLALGLYNFFLHLTFSP